MRTATIPISPGSDRSLFSSAAFWKMKASLENAVDHPEYARSNGASQRVAEFLKTAVTPISTSTASALSVNAMSGFFESLRSDSAFFSLLQNGAFVRVPFNTAAVVATSAASGAAYTENDQRALTNMALATGDGLARMEISAQVVVSNELLLAADGEAEDLVARELRGAVGTAADTRFLAILAAAATSMSGSGTSASAMVNDVKRLMGSVSITSRSKPVWIGTASTAKALAIGGSEDPALLRSMGMQGGELGGAPFLLSSGISDSDPSLYLLDAAAITANATDLSMQTARHASVQMNNAPDSPETVSTTLINLWQRNLQGIRASLYIGCDVVRSGAVGVMSGIAWATSSPSSP